MLTHLSSESCHLAWWIPLSITLIAACSTPIEEATFFNDLDDQLLEFGPAGQAPAPVTLALQQMDLLTAGGTTAFQVSGITAGEQVFLIGSPADPSGGAAVCPGPLAGECLDLTSPIRVIGNATATAGGLASINLSLPAGIALSEVWLQAVEPSGVFVSDVLNAPISDGTTDSDGDGLSDAAEQNNGTDPLLADTDGDGASDGDEILVFGTNPLIDDIVGFEEPPVWEADANGVYQLTMEPTILTVDDQNFCVRGYNGVVPGPTMRIAEGTDRQIRVDYANTFTVSDNQAIAGDTYDFNSTNLHTHGLHVQPERSSDDLYWADNVLIHMSPGTTNEYRFDIDEDHVHYPGTFWFHPHVHGATGIQVGSGMSGAWIIEGDYDNIPALDAADEHLFLMQHVAWESVSPMAAGDTCDQDNLSINDFAEITTQSRTLVNGRLEQWMAVAPDQAQHWRFIHAGVTDEMRIGLFPATSTDCSTWDETSPVAMFQIAADGLALQSRFSREELFMAPGYRIDVNFRAPTSDGLWCLIGERPAAGPPGPGAVAVDDLLARLMVDSDLTATSTALASSAHLASVAAPTIDCSSVPDGTQTALFDDPSPLCPPLNIDCRTFTDSVTDPRLLAVETLDEWTVTAGRATHPFHIHVNPFTVCDDRDDEPPAPHWRDTLMLTNVSASLMMEYPFYTGSFVTHCHKLNHEDSGMMEVIEIQ